MLGGYHGILCNAKTFPLRCPTCSAPVFFFSCDCGSKVFFDDLGVPWPIHDCDTSWTRRLKRTTDETGQISVELRPGVTITRPAPSFELGEDSVQEARNKAKQSKPDPIVRIDPVDGDSTYIIGILREVRPVSDPIKIYKLSPTRISYAMLGTIGRGAVGKITVHVPAQFGHDQTESFTAWIPALLLKHPRIVPGILVAVGLAAVRVPSGGCTWFCDDFEVIG